MDMLKLRSAREAIEEKRQQCCTNRWADCSAFEEELMATNPKPDKALAAAALGVLQGTRGGGQGGADSPTKVTGGPSAPKPQQPLDPEKKKVKKMKTASNKAFAEFKRDVGSRLTRIEQLLEQQAIMLRYPAPIYPQMVPAPNGAPPAPSSLAPRGQAYPPLPPPARPLPKPSIYPPPSQPPIQPSTSAVSGGADDGDPKRRRLFAGMDLRDHRKVSNKRGGRGTRKTCRKCAAEGIENVLLMGHKCPYGEARAVSGVKEVAGNKRASDGTPLSTIDPIRPRGPMQSMLPPVDTMLAPGAMGLPSAPQGVFGALPPHQQLIPSSQSGTGGKAG
ncbi:hypothetical protein KFL_001360220 [Klebsormidium nitens]|uniref:Uncharacterized protein n=1 Tax=Klebsormidium nitens TaxID=105231 RepID=A0A1Y1HWV7_KLENI|nr:hypothetical protein KFL_001360220 [Klebsormidium nitens]|eukprot:GAQ83125.1 hypothetical protein KFL_001360220 [Klebsormidium nitens]